MNQWSRAIVIFFAILSIIICICLGFLLFYIFHTLIPFLPPTTLHPLECFETVIEDPPNVQKEPKDYTLILNEIKELVLKTEEEIKEEIEYARSEIKDARSEIEDAHTEIQEARSEIKDARLEIERTQREVRRVRTQSTPTQPI